jgi:branched-chain amino acid transport system ATP-binding protein
LPLLAVERVTKDFGGLRALSQVDITVEAGQLVGLVGPNGAGKTTLFNIICGSYRPTSGRILYNGQEITGRLPHEIAARGIARTFQLTNLFPNVTVLENVLFGLHRSVESPLWRGFPEAIFGWGAFSRKEKAALDQAEEILRFLKLDKSRDLLASSLPHVDQRKIEIAIALAARPQLLLLDEPAAGMQMGEARELKHILNILRDRGITIMLVDHNMPFVMGICDHLVVLHFGVKIAEGSPQEIARHQDVKAVYLG